MKVERWLKVTHVEDDSNLRIDDTLQTNGVVVIHTRKKKYL